MDWFIDDLGILRIGPAPTEESWIWPTPAFTFRLTPSYDLNDLRAKTTHKWYIKDKDESSLRGLFSVYNRQKYAVTVHTAYKPMFDGSNLVGYIEIFVDKQSLGKSLFKTKEDGKQNDVYSHVIMKHVGWELTRGEHTVEVIYWSSVNRLYIHSAQIDVNGLMIE